MPINYSLPGQKCDEAKPACRNCLRYPAKCSFAFPIEERKKKTGTIVLKPKILPAPPIATTHLSTPHLGISESSSFSFNDFELLQHWTLKTAQSMAPNKSLQKAMIETVPQLALSQPYLM